MPVFNAVQAKEALVERLDRAVEDADVAVHAYCVMPNHLHVLVETPDDDQLPSMMHCLLAGYACWYKAKYSHSGHVFERRYRNVRCETERHLDEVCRYIVMNPVRAKLVQTPFEYPWSSFLQTIGVVEPRRFLNTEWTREWFAVLGTWPDEFVAYVEREDAPTDLSLFEDPRIVRLLENPTREGMVQAASDGVSLRIIAGVLGCSHSTVMRRLRAEMGQ
jgi:REP element-mobilizing transposase RayT